VHTHSATLHSVRYMEHVYTPTPKFTKKRRSSKTGKRGLRTYVVSPLVSQDLSLCVESRVRYGIYAAVQQMAA
jgi:hypothetical protein